MNIKTFSESYKYKSYKSYIEYLNKFLLLNVQVRKLIKLILISVGKGMELLAQSRRNDEKNDCVSHIWPTGRVDCGSDTDFFVKQFLL